MADMQFVAVRAVIEHNGKILIIRESQLYKDGANKGKWDFPGGKVKPGESLHNALLREVKEETGLDVSIGNSFHTASWSPDINGTKIHIAGTFFKCIAEKDEIVLSEDHDIYAWILKAEVDQYDLIKENKKALEILWSDL